MKILDTKILYLFTFSTIGWLFTTEVAYAARRSDPHFIPLVSKVQAYLTPNGEPNQGPDKYGGQAPHGGQQQNGGQEQYGAQKQNSRPEQYGAYKQNGGQKQYGGRTQYGGQGPRNIQYNEQQQEHPLSALTNAILGRTSQNEHRSGYGPAPPPAVTRSRPSVQYSRNTRQMNHPGNNGPSLKSVSNHKNRFSQKFPQSKFKFSSTFKQFEKSLSDSNNNNNQNSFSVPSFNKNSQNQFSFPSSNNHQNFPSFSGSSKNTVFGPNPFGSSGSQSPSSFNFGSLNSGSKLLNVGSEFQQPRFQKGTQQNNPSIKNNNYNNNNKFSFKSNNNQYGNSPFQEQDSNLFSFNKPSFGDKFNKAFQKYDTEFSTMFGKQGNGNYGNGVGFYGNNRNNYRRSNSPLPYSMGNSRPVNDGYQQQQKPNNGYYGNNYVAGQQQYPGNNYGGNFNSYGQRSNSYGKNNFNYNARPNVNSNYGQPKRTGYGGYGGGAVGAGFPPGSPGLLGGGGGGLPGPMYNRRPPPPGPVNNHLIQTQANLAPHSHGIDGMSDLYTWLGNDEPILKQFS